MTDEETKLLPKKVSLKISPSIAKCKLVEEYIKRCTQFRVQPDPTVIICLGARSPVIAFSKYGHFEGCLLPLEEVMLEYPEDVKHITKINLSQPRRRRVCGEGNSNCIILSRMLEAHATLEHIDLTYNGIDQWGIDFLLDGLSANKSVNHLMLKGNFLNPFIATKISSVLKAREVEMKMLDVSFCSLGFDGASSVVALQKESRALDSRRPGCVHVAGNFETEELWNSITHGFGMALSILGTILLMVQVSGSPTPHIWGCVLFCIGLLTVFTSSTLYHSLFLVEGVLAVFQTLDHCAIFLLIAGSYSPFCLIYATPRVLLMLQLQWLTCFIGIAAHSASRYAAWGSSRFYLIFELCLYMLMGNAIFFVWSDIEPLLHPHVLHLIAAGGACYMLGVPFFVCGEYRPLCHSIWHVFVLVGAIIHWFAVSAAVHDAKVSTTISSAW